MRHVENIVAFIFIIKKLNYFSENAVPEQNTTIINTQTKLIDAINTQKNISNYVFSKLLIVNRQLFSVCIFDNI